MARPPNRRTGRTNAAETAQDMPSTTSCQSADSKDRPGGFREAGNASAENTRAPWPQTHLKDR